MDRQIEGIVGRILVIPIVGACAAGMVIPALIAINSIKASGRSIEFALEMIGALHWNITTSISLVCLRKFGISLNENDKIVALLIPIFTQIAVASSNMNPSL